MARAGICGAAVGEGRRDVIAVAGRHWETEPCRPTETRERMERLVPHRTGHISRTPVTSCRGRSGRFRSFWPRRTVDQRTSRP
jgi:hypothetical protein